MQTVWSESALFAQAYLSENLGSLRYDSNSTVKKTQTVRELLISTRSILSKHG